MARGLLSNERVRGLQWWNSGSWTIGSADGMVWTSRRALRRARAIRALKIFVTLLVALAVGGLIALLVERRGFAQGAEAGIQVGACPPACSLARPL